MKRRRTRANGEGSIYQRKADGIWVGALVLANGRRKVVYGSTKAKAVSKLEELKIGTATLGVPQTDERLTVETYFNHWYAEHSKSLRPSSARTYESLIRIHIIPTLGTRRLSSLTTQQLERFFGTVKLSPKSVSILKGVMSGALDDAIKWGYLRQNVAHLADIPRMEASDVEPIGPDEARAIIKAFGAEKLAPLVTIALTTGLRQGELLALRPEDVDLDARKLYVRHTLNRIAGEYRLVEPKTKRSRRVVPLMDLSIEAFHQQAENQATMKLLKGDSWKNDLGLLFTLESGAPMLGTVVTAKFQRGLVNAGLTARRFHELRHGFATLLLSQGVSSVVIMELMGHRNLSTSLVYTHVVPQLHKDAAQRLDDAIG